MGLNQKEVRNKVLHFLKNHPKNTYKQKTLSKAIHIPKQNYPEFKDILRQMSDQGEIERFKSNRYSYPQEKRIVTGDLSITSKGFGFVLMDNERDIFISYDNLANSMDGDLVRALVFKQSFGKNPEGKVLEVLERSMENIVGVFRKYNGGGMVYPEDDRLKSPLYIPPDKIQPDGKQPIQNGQIVVAQLEDWADPRDNPHGYITDVLGFPDEPKMDLRIVAKSKDLDLEFPDDVKHEEKQLAEPDWKNELKRRLDLRDTLCFTIDPEDAKDFDDAVSFRQKETGRFELGVHIADVSHFVRQGSAIDREAWKRGTSVYFVQHVIPMLPERLSSDLCSLKPDEDRLAFSVIMELDSSGTVYDYQITESVIHSDCRFTYEEVENVIKGASHKFAETIHLMQMMSLTLQRQRSEMGSIDFDIPEPIFSLDEHGIPYEVRPSARLHSHRLIEEFMLLANRTIAEHIYNQSDKTDSRLPFVYRIHEKPPSDDLASFMTLLKNLGITYQVNGEINPEDFRNILDIVENLEFKYFVEKVALRSMSKARYSPDNLGHFGLAFGVYTHFTSPIRRYPDLVVHRLLKQYQTKRPKDTDSLMEYLRETCDQSSEMEINALEAEREYAKIKSMEFLSQKVGEEFHGIISGVTSFGAFVELTYYMVEGLVPLSRMRGDYYIYDKDKYQLLGKRTGKRYRLGDRVRVRVDSVSVEDRQADFTFIEENE
ncbi:MAG TPA: ribonuclease R [bacterium]|nr:ribonuclease R [bacterium]